ncbi:MAG: hypothetical protein GF400_01620 [Candidatus Eisenbacteria bacterium]|nr:hypothetical protein [Candidatus Eisenbacteria bacterium]
MDDRRWAEKHLTMLGVFHIVYHTIAFFIGIGIIALLSYLGDLTGDPQGHAVLTMLGGVFGSILIVVAVPGVVGGIGILKRQPWARILTLIVGAVDLLDIPLGTALGIYTFWVLMRDEIVGHFAEK